jgi:hypothetical protein
MPWHSGGTRSRRRNNFRRRTTRAADGQSEFNHETHELHEKPTQKTTRESFRAPFRFVVNKPAPARQPARPSSSPPGRGQGWVALNRPKREQRLARRISPRLQTSVLPSPALQASRPLRGRIRGSRGGSCSSPRSSRSPAARRSPPARRGRMVAVCKHLGRHHAHLVPALIHQRAARIARLHRHADLEIPRVIPRAGQRRDLALALKNLPGPPRTNPESFRVTTLSCCREERRRDAGLHRPNSRSRSSWICFDRYSTCSS